MNQCALTVEDKKKVVGSAHLSADRATYIENPAQTQIFFPEKLTAI